MNLFLDEIEFVDYDLRELLNWLMMMMTIAIDWFDKFWLIDVYFDIVISMFVSTMIMVVDDLSTTQFELVVDVYHHY